MLSLFPSLQTCIDKEYLIFLYGLPITFTLYMKYLFILLKENTELKNGDFLSLKGKWWFFSSKILNLYLETTYYFLERSNIELA